jgi:hypothetical protein
VERLAGVVAGRPSEEGSVGAERCATVQAPPRCIHFYGCKRFSSLCSLVHSDQLPGPLLPVGDARAGTRRTRYPPPPLQLPGGRSSGPRAGNLACLLLSLALDPTPSAGCPRHGEPPHLITVIRIAPGPRMGRTEGVTLDVRRGELRGPGRHDFSSWPLPAGIMLSLQW